MPFWKKKSNDLNFDLGSGGKDDLGLGLPASDAGQQQPPPDSFGAGFDNQGMMDHGQQPSFGQQDSFAQQDQPMGMQPLGMQQQQMMQPQADDSGSMRTSIELINAKLDAIKSELDAINQRIIKIERIADEDYKSQQKKIW